MRSPNHRVLALILAAVAPACFTQSHAIEIVGAFGTDPETCLANTDVQIYRGTLDVAVAGAAFAVSLSMENTLTDNTQVLNFQTNTRDVTIEAAEIRYEGLDGAANPAPPSTTQVYGFAKAGGRFDMAGVLLVPTSVVDATKTLPGIVAIARFTGRTTDGTAVSSPEIRYPISYCTGCTADPTCFVANDPANPDDPNSTTDDPLDEADDADGPVIAPVFACGGAGFTNGTPSLAVCPVRAP